MAMHSVCLANSGISLFALYIPAMLWLLPAVIVWEVLAARARLSHSWLRMITAISIANLSSTAVGFVTWLAYNFGIAGLLSAFGRGPFTNTVMDGFFFTPSRFNPWTSSLIVLTFFSICLVVSVQLEAWIISKFFREVSRDRLSKFSWRVHIPAYVIFVGLWLALAREIVVTANE